MQESIIFSEHDLTEKVHYVYRVTIDGKYYIGKRSGLLNDLATGTYTTSSKLVQEKLQNGHHFSKIKIIQVFSSSKEALAFESRILTRVNAKANPKFLNQCNGGNGNYTCKGHTEKSKEKMSKSQKTRFDINTEEGRKQRENNSEKTKEQFDENTEEGIKRREDVSKKSKAQFDETTEEGRKQRENLSESKKEYYKTEEGIKRCKDMSEKGIERFNPNTEEGIKRRENHSKKMKLLNDINTEEGIKRREDASKKSKALYDINTEEGIKRRENHSNKMKERFNPDTEEGRRNKEKRSQSAKAQFDINTEEGKIRRENHSKIIKEKAKEHLQNRKDASILGDLMFDEDFIRENFLILDDKNNLRFLWSVYSKLTGFSKSFIDKGKREGKLSFLSGIRSISLTEELENSKIREIEAIIKSRNEGIIT